MNKIILITVSLFLSSTLLQAQTSEIAVKSNQKALSGSPLETIMGGTPTKIDDKYTYNLTSPTVVTIAKTPFYIRPNDMLQVEYSNNQFKFIKADAENKLLIELRNYWMSFVVSRLSKKEIKVTVHDIAELEKKSLELIVSVAKHDKELLNIATYFNQGYQISTLNTLIWKNIPVDSSCTIFLDKFDTSNDYISLLEDPFTILNAYQRIYSKLSADSFDMSNYISKILNIKNDSIKERFVGITLEFAIRYKGMEKWIEQSKADFNKKIASPTLKKTYNNFIETYHYMKQGEQAPEFSLTNSVGERVSLSKYRGKIIVIDVWGTWCSGCIKALPKFVELQEQYKENKDIIFITIALEKLRKVPYWIEMLKTHNLNNMINLVSIENGDGAEFRTAYNIMGAPRYFIIDRAGKFVSVYQPHPGTSEFDQLLRKSINKK